MKVLFLESHPMWIHGLPNGFADAGHTSIISGPLTRGNITEMIDTFRPDLIISMGWTPEHTIDKQCWIRDSIKNYQIPLVYWATEDPLHTKNFTLPLIKRMKPDFVFTVSRSMCDFYRKKSFNAAHLDFGYHKSVHHRVDSLDNYSCDIAVVANAYPEYLLKEPDVFRMISLETLIFPLLNMDIRIDFWGNHWDSMSFFIKRKIPRHWLHGYLDYKQAYKVYSSAKIVIGLQNCVDQLTQRTYEVLGSGGFLLTSNSPAVKEKFIPDRHLIVSSSPEETINKVKYYLSHHEERELIRENAQEAIQNESYKHRAEQMLEELDNQGIPKDSISSGQGKVISYPKFIRKNYEVHVAKPGDTLLHISKIYGVSPKHIMKLNHFKSDFIYAGDLLKIKEKQRIH